MPSLLETANRQARRSVVDYRTFVSLSSFLGPFGLLNRTILERGENTQSVRWRQRFEEFAIGRHGVAPIIDHYFVNTQIVLRREVRDVGI